MRVELGIATTEDEAVLRHLEPPRSTGHAFDVNLPMIEQDMDLVDPVDMMKPPAPPKTKANWVTLNVQNPLAFYAVNTQLNLELQAFDQNRNAF